MALRRTRDRVSFADLMVTRSGLTNDKAERCITIAEWLDLPEDEPGEFVDGRLVEEEVPSFTHEGIVSWVIVVLTHWLRAKGGRVLSSNVRYAVNEHRGRKPDVSAYFPGSRLPQDDGSLDQPPPDLLVEVVSPGKTNVDRDRVEKPPEYALLGARWYWIIDPQEKTVELFELGADGRYVLARSARNGTVADVPGLEGLTLDLDALWSEVAPFSPPPSTK